MWIHKNFFLFLCSLCFVHFQSQNPKRSTTKRNISKRNLRNFACRIDLPNFRDCQWQTKMPFSSPWKTRLGAQGTLENTRQMNPPLLSQTLAEYPSNFSNYTQASEWEQRGQSQDLNQGSAISRSLQYPSIHIWKKLQDKKSQWHSSHTDTSSNWLEQQLAVLSWPWWGWN